MKIWLSFERIWKEVHTPSFHYGDIGVDDDDTVPVLCVGISSRNNRSRMAIEKREKVYNV